MDYYDYSIAGGIAGGAIAGVMAFLVIMVIICIAIAVLEIVGVWKILKKAGKPGWGALIPIYNQYLLCQITGVNPWWLLIICLGSIVCVIPVLGTLVYMAAAIYFTILLNVSLARSFGKEDGFAVGLILLSPIFTLILGTGSSKYLGAKPMNDVVFNKINQNKNNDSTTSTANESNQTDVKFCTECGNKIDKDTKFCPSCGKEVN